MKRTFKNGYAVCTFPSNNGFCTQLVSKYGETLKTIYGFTPEEANRNHNRLMSAI